MLRIVRGASPRSQELNLPVMLELVVHIDLNIITPVYDEC